MRKPNIPKSVKENGELTEKEKNFVEAADYSHKEVEVSKKRNRNAVPVSYSLTENDMKIFKRMYEIILKQKEPHDKFPKNSDIIKMGLRKLDNINDEKQIINLYYDVLKK
ncbi:MAG TPA: hypothetical protein QF753_07240 [Victivallales bacterium]|nr:hypothetical protein [Victivallales bacterium]